MKSKRLLLMLLMAFALPWAAQAQETLTVHAGTETSRFVPFYGYYADDAQTNQMIYPATELADMAGGEISAMMLYWTNGGYSGGSGVGTWTISIGETSATTLSGLDNTTSLTQVFTGGLDALFYSNNTLPITFDNAYTYNGGNLLVQFSHSASSYKDYAFYGETVTGASYCYNSQRNFLPKTTFTYTPNPNYCGKPANVHIVENTLGPREVAIEWDAESGELFQISMQATSSFDPNDINWSDATTSHYEEWDLLEPETDYTFCVRKKCGTDSYSQPVTLTFRTTVACPAPTLALTANSETARGATVSWTGFSDSYTLQYIDPATATITGYEVKAVEVLSEGFEGGSMPEDWIADSYWNVGSGTGNSSGGSTSAGTGDYNAYCYRASYDGEYYLITPKMNLGTATSATLTFQLNNTSWGGDINELHVLYRVNEGSWNTLSNASWTTSTSGWETKTVTLAGFADNYQIAFYCVSNYSYGTGIDEIQINAVMPVPVYEWNEIENATSPYTFNTLLPETTYNVRVIGDCGSDGNSQPSNVVSFTTLESCPTPQNLAVTTDGATATATWTGTEGTCNISINGTVTNNVTSPYIFNVNLSTTYEVMVQANCTGETGNWSDVYSFTTPPCVGGHVIEYTLNDSYGDGWIGGTNNPTISAILINEACDIYETLTLPANTYTGSGSLTLCGEYYQLVWQAGAYPGECSFTLIVDGTPVYTNQSGSSLTDGQVLLTLGTAPDMLPKPTDIANGTPDNREVELSWTEIGTATAWEICVNGDEDNPIGVRENPYTLDGLTPDTDYAVKVRSTNGTDVSCWTDEITFHTAEACAKPTNLATTDVTVNSIALTWDGTNDSYEVRYIESTSTADFEEGMGVWTTIDADGDGFTWLWSGTTTGVSGNNGSSYAAYSQSYDNDGDQVLYPDNYLVSPKVLLGGSITFYACAQDASWAAEHFGVAVSTTGNTDAADFTTIQEWTMNSDGTGTPGAKTQGTWGKFTVDLSAYSGEGYVAIRHFNCSDKFYIDVDDITINMPESAPWQYVDGITENTYTIENLTGNTSYAIQVRGYCQGEADPSNWTEAIYASTINGNVFITEGNWNVDGNWRGGVVPPAGCDVVIEANVTVPAGYVADAGRITVEGNAEITVADGGQLKTTFGGVYATMRKSINGYGTSEGGYILLANPVKADQNPMYLGLTDGEFDLYAFDQIEADEWRNYETSAFNLVNGQGYLYANEDDVDLAFTGELYPTNANIKVTMNYVDGVEFPGYNLFGNPYSCNAYIADGRAFYVMNSDGDEIIPANTNAIAPMQGVFVVATAIGNLNFTSVEPEQVNQTLNINLTSQSALIDRAVINFNEGESLRKFQLNPNHTKVYIPQDNDYAVVYTEDNVGEMPVSFKAEKNGTYSLSFTSQEVSFSYLHLIDNMTGNDVNLLETPSYTFNASTTDYANRFRLVFATGSTVDGENFGFINNSGNLCIFGIEGEATMQVVDMMGRVLSSETFSGSYEKSLNAAPGVYMIRLINGNDVKVQKIVVK